MHNLGHQNATCRNEQHGLGVARCGTRWIDGEFIREIVGTAGRQPSALS
jgi:hypothetical protein